MCLLNLEEETLDTATHWAILQGRSLSHVKCHLHYLTLWTVGKGHMDRQLGPQTPEPCELGWNASAATHNCRVTSGKLCASSEPQ